MAIDGAEVIAWMEKVTKLKTHGIEIWWDNTVDKYYAMYGALDASGATILEALEKLMKVSGLR